MNVRGTANRVGGLVLARGWPTGRSPSRPDAVALAPSELARWSDYFAVAATARFRATQRARLRDAARTGMLVVVAASLFDCLWLIPFHPDAVLLLVGTNALTGLVAAAGYVWLRSRPRQRPEVAVYGILATVDIATVVLAVASPTFGLLAAGYLLLLPTIVALVVPWSTRHHVWWLVVHAAFALAYAVVAADSALPGGRAEKVALMLMASGVSQVGHGIALRARVRSFVQIERIRALNRLGRRNAERLDHLNEVLEVTARTDEPRASRTG